MGQAGNHVPAIVAFEALSAWRTAFAVRRTAGWHDAARDLRVAGAAAQNARSGRLLTGAEESEAAQRAFDLRYMWSDSVEVLI